MINQASVRKSPSALQTSRPPARTKTPAWSADIPSYGSVRHRVSHDSDMSVARSILSDAQAGLSSARAHMENDEYESVVSDAGEARGGAQSAKGAAEQVRSREYNRFQSLVSALKAPTA